MTTWAKTSSVARGCAAAALLFGCAEAEESTKLEGLVGILITPDPVVVPVGGAAQLTATGLLDTRESVDLTNLVVWKSRSANVVAIQNGLDREGEVEGMSAGNTTVVAQYGDVTSPPATITVTDAELLRLTVQPTAVQLGVGESLNMTAEAGFSDGSSGDFTGQVRWITADGDVAQLQGDGLLTAVGTGETSIHAEWEALSSASVPVTVTEQSTGEPDLVISALSGSASDGIISFSVQVENVGASSASSFWVDAWADPASTPSVGDIGDDFVWISYLGAGQSETLSFDLAGTQSVYVLADTNDDVVESDESNNLAAGTVAGGGTDDGPDLTVTYFDYVSDHYSIYYFAEVTNAGGREAGSFYVDVFVDADDAPEVGMYGDSYALMDSLGAGESGYVEAYVYTHCSWCWSWVMVDSLDWVDETNEGNNVAGPLDVFSY